MGETRGQNLAGLKGERVRIRRTKRADLRHLARWWADHDVMAPLLCPEGIRMTPQEQDRWFRRWCETPGGSCAHYIIVDEHDSPIGEVDYHDLDDIHRRGWITLKIGERSLWGKGYAGDAAYTFCKYMFETLGVQELAIEVALTNSRGLAFWRKMGFVSYARGTDYVNMRLRAETFRDRPAGSFYRKKQR